MRIRNRTAQFRQPAKVVALFLLAGSVAACAITDFGNRSAIATAAALLSPEYDPDNLIARTVRGDTGLPKLYENEYAVAFLIDRPAARGHFLVALKKSHARNFLDLNDADALAVMEVAQTVAAAEMKAIGAQGFTLRQNNGSASSVAQYHLHVVPRWSGDTVPPGVGKEIEVASLEADAAAIRAVLNDW